MSGLSNLPPGVTGNEWEIAGYPPCGRMGCGHDPHNHLEDGLRWHLDTLGEPCACIEEEHDEHPQIPACQIKDCECEGYTPYPDRDEYEPDLEAGT